MSKPIAFKIDKSVRNIANLPNKGGYGILYKCPQCNNPLCIWLGKNEKFCHNCGESLFWGGVITHINSQQSERIDNDTDGLYEVGILEIINQSIELDTEMTSTCYIKEEGGI